MSSTTPAPRRRRWIVLGLSLIGLLLIGAAVWVGVRALLVKDELEALMPLADDVAAAAAAGDIDELSEITPEIAVHAQRARDLTGDPVWWVSEAIPVIGPNLHAVRVVSRDLGALSEVLPQLTESVSALAEPDTDGLVDTDVLASAADALGQANDIIQGSVGELEAIDPSALVPQVAGGVVRLRDALVELAPGLEGSAQALSVLPATLGGDGERTIVVTIQNSAELRSGGGITGTFAELRADKGQVSLTGQSDAADFPILDAPIVTIPESTTTLYGDGVGRYVQNTTMTPDFALTGDMVSAWWEGLTGAAPDTVIAVDPTVLRAVLSATGPVDVAAVGEISADNVIDALLVQPYLTLLPEEQNLLFAGIMDEVFARLSSGDIDPVALLRALEGPLAEGRISIWSHHADEQEVFAASTLGGALARQDAAGDGAFAVYFNDRTGGKMAPFLAAEIDVTAGTCGPDGLIDMAIGVTLTSTAPDEVVDLPFSVTGGGLSGVAVGDIGTNVTIMAPPDSFLGAVTVGGQPYPAATAVDSGRTGATVGLTLPPGESGELVVHFLVPADQAEAPQVLHTPLFSAPTVTTVPGTCDAVSP